MNRASLRRSGSTPSPGASERVTRPCSIACGAMPDVRERLLGGGLDPVGGTPDEFGRFIRGEIVKWSKIATDVGAKAE